jgi:putative heme-binding domain-containing protein
MRVLNVLLALSLLNSPAASQLGARRPVSVNPLAQNKAAVEAGERRFKQLCTGCHGARGEGGQGEGQGPNLTSSWEVRRASDARLTELIRNGIPGTAMPPFALPADQIRELAAFVRSLNAPAISVPVSGDPAAGESVFVGKGGCVDCHMQAATGGYLGPDLSNAGATQRVDELRNAILKPSARASTGFRPVTLDTRNGRVRGIVRHYSNWSMQVLDEHGQIHLLRGPEMKRAVPQPKSWMPDDYAQRLTKEEVENLVAFLSRQTVRSQDKSEAAPAKGSVEPAAGALIPQ